MRLYRLVADFLAGRRSESGAESRPDFYIVLRPGPDWKSLTPSAFEEESRRFCRLIGRPEDQLNEHVRLWDATFGISFFETRQAMKDIALANFREVRDARLVGLEQVIRGDTGPGIYLFTDDDDWIRPDILDVLHRSRRRKTRAYVWGSVVLGGKRPIVRRKLSRTCYTNNYAVDHAYFTERPEGVSGLCQHWDADVVIRKRDLCLVPEYLSITNKNPSSTLSLAIALRDGATSAALLKAVRRFHRRLRKLQVPEAFSWAGPCVLEVKTFYSRLFRSRR